MGRQHTKTEGLKSMVSELGGLIDSMKVESRALMVEKQAHVDQTVSFCTQVNQASANISNAVKRIEDSHLAYVRAETERAPAPPSLMGRTTARDIQLSEGIPGTFSVTSSEPSSPLDVRATPVETLIGDGTFTNKRVKVHIVNGVVAAIDAVSPGSAPFKKLIGKKDAVAAVILNRDLDMICNHGMLHPDWLDLFQGPIDKQKKASFLAFIKQFPTAKYQWVRQIRELTPVY